MIRTAFAAVLLSWLALSGVADAAPKRQPKGPDFSKHENRLKMLELIGRGFDTRVRPIGYDSDDLDRELERYVQRGTSTPLAETIDDAAFLRRVSIDLTGRVPTAEQIAAFEADADPKKREKKIDELLASDAWARKWARYWRKVIFHAAPGMRNQTNPQALEDHLFAKLKAGAGWDKIVGELIAANPQRKKDTRVQDNGWNQDTGYNNFVLSSDRKPTELASRTARLFMGISIECAECHDHPFDDWKREQFHELAAFFSPGRYYMPDLEDPKERHLMQPKFLLGETPPPRLDANERRIAIAAFLIYNPDNYWFARSFVNRVWSELIGDGFYSVDSLGPDKDVVHKLLVNRIGAQFRAETFDVRWLFRLICNSEAYQREAAPISDAADLFTAVSPTKLRPWEIADRVQSLSADPAKPAPSKVDQGMRREVETTFDQNPSIPHSDLEGTMQQALLLMNSPRLHNTVATAEWMKRLRRESDNDAVVDEAFLRILARRPTPTERVRYRSLLRTADDRVAAIEDIVWVLMNSAEFLTKT